MLFTEFEFIFYFVPLLLALYHLVRKDQHRTFLLFSASLLFYGLWDWHFIPLMLFSIVTNFVLAKKIDHTQAKKKRKRYTALAVCLALLPLLYFKYAAFFADTLSLDIAKKLYDGVLPLGISFYTFQQITYIIDIYKKQQAAEYCFARYGFFVTFFPQLIAGPIVHYKELVPQIGKKTERNRLFGEGLVYFAIGYIKKFIVADNIAYLINPIYTAAAGDQHMHVLNSMTATLGYTFQLYFDFSGYSDMAMGLALLFGFRLPINFNSPYKSGSIIEFWRRWHITLSRFLKDYIYIPFGGGRYTGSEKWKRARNLMLTMLIGGLWHGANWSFVFWGGIHGLALMINHKMRSLWGEALGIRRLCGFAFTFIFVALAWVLFRAEDTDIAWNIYKGFSTLPETWDFKTAHLWLLVGGALALMPNSHLIAKRTKNIHQKMGGYMRIFMATRAPFYLILSHAILFPIIVSFYTSNWDKDFYRNLPLKHETRSFIDNSKGDLRKNLYTNTIFVNDTKKVFIVGSSFTTVFGHYTFQKDGLQYESTSLGMGGNPIFTGIRNAVNLLDTDAPDVMVFGVSALNMLEIDDVKLKTIYKKQRPYVGAFSKQCLDATNALGFRFKQDILSSCHNDDYLSLWEKINIYCCFSGDRFYQLHGFLQHLTTWKWKNDIISYPKILFDSASRDAFFTEFEKDKQTALENPKPPKDLKNGINRNFKWENRKSIKSVSPGGSLYRTFDRIAKLAKEKGTTFVIYDTPTVMHKDHPDVYPEGYHERYIAAVKQMCADHNIPYYDFSELYPWHGDFFLDFIHTLGHERKRLHKYILYTLEKDGLL